MGTHVFFRNDDVNTLDKELIGLTEIFIRERIPITHAVEPANVKDDTADWLIDMKRKTPDLIEIMQHGFDHKKRDLGEFGGKRSYSDQHKDLLEGKKVMQERFGGYFLNAINFPFGPYNQHTIRAIDDLQFDIVSSHYNFRISRRAFYFIGNWLKKGQIMGKHVSHHMCFYPGTKLFEIDMCISFIKKYIGGYSSNRCIFGNVELLMRQYDKFRKHTNVIGILLHHRYHNTKESIDLVRKTIDRLKQDQDAVFTSFSELYRKRGMV